MALPDPDGVLAAFEADLSDMLGVSRVSLGGDAVVATVFPDDNKKYLSTDLLRDEPAKDGFVSPEVTLVAFGAFKRVCRTCCDPAECGMPDLMYAADAEGHAPPCPLWRG